MLTNLDSENCSIADGDNSDNFDSKIVGEMTALGRKTGSRDSDGNVPNVNFNSDKVNVNWYNPDNSNDNLRSRSEVSHKKEQ